MFKTQYNRVKCWKADLLIWENNPKKRCLQDVLGSTLGKVSVYVRKSRNFGRLGFLDGRKATKHRANFKDRMSTASFLSFQKMISQFQPKTGGCYPGPGAVAGGSGPAAHVHWKLAVPGAVLSTAVGLNSHGAVHSFFVWNKCGWCWCWYAFFGEMSDNFVQFFHKLFQQQGWNHSVGSCSLNKYTLPVASPPISSTLPGQPPTTGRFRGWSKRVGGFGIAVFFDDIKLFFQQEDVFKSIVIFGGASNLDWIRQQIFASNCHFWFLEVQVVATIIFLLCIHQDLAAARAESQRLQAELDALRAGGSASAEEAVFSTIQLTGSVPKVWLVAGFFVGTFKKSKGNESINNKEETSKKASSVKHQTSQKKVLDGFLQSNQTKKQFLAQNSWCFSWRPIRPKLHVQELRKLRKEHLVSNERSQKSVGPVVKIWSIYD